MPPIVPRKRLRKSPLPHDAPGHGKVPPTQSTNKRKATLYDDLDASATPLSSKDSGFILENYQDNGSISSLTSLSDEDFEDVPPAKRQKTSELKDEDEDTNIEFEDVTAPVASAADAPITSGDLELTLNRDSHLSLIDSYGSKKGPTKREKQVRRATHCLHVLFLLWHNAVRNSWLSHPEMQAIMLSHLPPRMWEEVDRWRQNSGLERRPPQQRNGKGKQDACRKTKNGSREWDKAAEKLEAGSVDMSHGDPIFRMMQSLASWWKQRFRVVNPGLRKWGYMDLERLDRLTKAHRTQAYDPVRFGEKVSDLKDMMRSARRCQGSRDVGAQLFTTLLRGLGLEARMVVNLQCLGFGWNKLEDADPENEADMAKCRRNGETSSKGKETASGNTQHSRTNMRGSRGPPAGPKKEQTNYITLDDTDDLGLEFNDTDDESVVELSSTPKRPPKPMKKFDSDLEFPHYWTEVLSPVTRTYLPVDPIVKGVIATNRELIETLEPRGAKAERSREIVAYIIGYSPDGTAKDVTVRYLKNQRLPGRTKGNRMPIEKLPVYNRIGKVKRYEQYDWFKTAMSGYRRGDVLHPVTEVDETEDATDLKPSQPEKKQVKEGEETLQYYKQSKEYILERHLKREEALRPGAKPVRVFKNKAKGAKGEEEDVYLRSDAVHVRSAETWHKQGRAPKPGTQPLKHVPYRAATLNRRREILEAEAATGEKVLQGLFSIDQTEWIVPPPIKDGVIPKNEYGNIDLFAAHMCPKGAIHVPFRGATKVCKRLQIDYAEAVVDFEFGHRMAVPVIQGVVIAEEYHERVLEELEKDEAERSRKQDEKRRKEALGKWRRFLMGLRIAERIRQEYGEIGNSVSVFGHDGGSAGPTADPKEAKDEDVGGGFLPEGYEEEHEDNSAAHHSSSFFPVAYEEDADADDGLIMEDHQHEIPGERKRPRAEKAAGEGKRASRSAPPGTGRRPRRRGRGSVVGDVDSDDDDDGAGGGGENPDSDDDGI